MIHDTMISLIIALLTAGTDWTSWMTTQLIATGLDWNTGIFVQEYWQGGKPRYAIANHGGIAARITVYESRTWNRLAGPWQVNPHGLVQVDADSLQGKDLLEFRLETGQSLGLLDAPRAPAALSLEAGQIATVQGLNGSGGRSEDLWFEQQSLVYKPESVASLRILVRPNIGNILFRKGKLPELNAFCDTLTISSSAEEISIDTNAGTAGRSLKYHVVTLRFRVPKAAHPMMMVVDGWHWTTARKAGHGVTRGILVDPRSE